jgi:predicted nucleic acid-binding protein
MPTHPFRVYVDTCIFGGAFDDEFATATAEFLRQARNGRFILVTSALVIDEIAEAPEHVRALFGDMLAAGMVAVETPGEAFDLQQAYLDAGVVTARWADDALHVATATVADCAMIVSWNFRHTVHFQKIPLYNAVNVGHGYRALAIYSPLEVIGNDEEAV